jgi:gamma-glutamyl phosphate reductase
MASGIKFYNIINWLLSQETEIPQEFLDNRSKLNSIVPYLTEQLWLNPKLINYLNKHVNNLYNIPDPIEQLNFLKKIFKLNHITKFDLYQFIPERSPDIIKEIEGT